MDKYNLDVAKKLKSDLRELSCATVRSAGKTKSNLLKRVGIRENIKEDNISLVGEIFINNRMVDYIDVELDIDLEENSVCGGYCGCHNFYRKTMFGKFELCEHLVIILNRYIFELENGGVDHPRLEEFKEQKRKYIVAGLINSLDNSRKKELLKLEVFLSKNNSSSFNVSFKIGKDKLYVIKNIGEFIDALENDVDLAFGKNFIYEPNMQYFSKEDLKIVDFVREYVGISRLASNGMYGFNRQNNSLVNGKSMHLKESSLKRFLELVLHKEINVEFEEIQGKTKVVKGDIPIGFSLMEKDNRILLQGSKAMPKLLDYYGEVCVYDEKIYLSSREHGAIVKSFVEALSIEGEIAFDKDEQEKVFTKVVPVIKKITKNIEMDKDLEEKVEVNEFAVEFYFDRNRDNVWCDVKAKYGDESFNILKGYGGDKYIVRDSYKEDEVVEKLENFKFYKDKDRFVFTGNEEDMFNFLSKDMKSFNDKGEVYYSDRFKEQKIYRAESINAEIKEKKDYLQFKFSVGDVEPKEFKNILKAFKNKRKFFKLKNNSFIDLEEKSTKDFLSLVESVAGDEKFNKDVIDISKARAIYLSNSMEENGLDFIGGKEIVDTIKEKFNSLDSIDYEIPKDLTATLRDYQVTGFKWFKTISHYGFGGILADEMGLGKTVQTIAFLLSEKGKKSLIVTPTSLIYNWKNEFEKFAKTMKVCVLHGDKESRLSAMKDVSGYDVILTTYGTLRNDFSEYEKLKFDYCIIDEGQNIKNPLALSSEAVKEVNAKVKFALTGTPIENNLMELWSIFDFVMPGYLHNKTRFKEKFIGKKDEESMMELKKLIKAFILRREKANVIKELPDKIEKKFFVEMTEEQKKIYSVFVRDIQEKMESDDFSNEKITVFSYLTKLRQLCLDPSVLVEDYKGGASKIDVALDIISENIEGGNKVLLFSQFTSVLANIKERLDRENIGYYYLDGGTKATRRIDLVNSFNEDKEKMVFLISLKAGGTGLNLTSANVVIHFDPWWNPAIEDQATDRAHRIGQKNVVEVIKLIAQGTVEEKIITMQESKKELINKVMEGDFKEGSFLSSLSDKEIKDLFKE